MQHLHSTYAQMTWMIFSLADLIRSLLLLMLYKQLLCKICWLEKILHIFGKKICCSWILLVYGWLAPWMHSSCIQKTACLWRNSTQYVSLLNVCQMTDFFHLIISPVRIILASKIKKKITCVSRHFILWDPLPH